jgi:diguanylate cyclase (GGDEF)-like protein/PAS domain S-box-containing protein
MSEPAKTIHKKKPIQNKKPSKTIEASEVKFRRMFESSHDGILLIDGETGEIMEVNPFFSLLLGYPKNEVIGETLWECDPFKRVIGNRDAFLELRLQESMRRDKLPLETRRRKIVHVEMVCVRYEVDGKDFIQCNLRDISERVQAENQVVFISNHDMLTNLYNRSYFDEELHRLENSRQFPISIFMLDVDGLKTVNDLHGHMAGDNLLKRTAQVLKSCFRDEDIIARIGGDEFAVLLSNTNQQASENIRLRMERTLKQHNQNFSDRPLSLSIGAATLNEQGSLDDLFKKADEIMYKHKKAKSGNPKKDLAEQMDLLSE